MKARLNNYFEYEPGKWSEYPLNRSEALELNIRFYRPIYENNPCPRPGHEPASIVYTKTGIRRCCALRDAPNIYDEAIFVRKEPHHPIVAKNRGLDFYWKDHPGKDCGHPGKTTLSGKCWFCEEERKKPSPRQAAILSGQKWYQPADNDPCKNGHLALRKVNGGECSECRGVDPQEKRGTSPRQAAILSGQKWYQPAENDPCKNGHLASRRVQDGLCSECTNTHPPNKEPSIQDLHPDMIIDRDAAKAFGFKVYRTGKPCTKNHTGWRYVSTTGCLDCLREK